MKTGLSVFSLPSLFCCCSCVQLLVSCCMSACMHLSASWTRWHWWDQYLCKQESISIVTFNINQYPSIFFNNLTWYIKQQRHIIRLLVSKGILSISSDGILIQVQTQSSYFHCFQVLMLNYANYMQDSFTFISDKQKRVPCRRKPKENPKLHCFLKRKSN